MNPESRVEAYLWRYRAVGRVTTKILGNANAHDVQYDGFFVSKSDAFDAVAAEVIKHHMELPREHTVVKSLRLYDLKFEGRVEVSSELKREYTLEDWA